MKCASPIRGGGSSENLDSYASHYVRWMRQHVLQEPQATEIHPRRNVRKLKQVFTPATWQDPFPGDGRGRFERRDYAVPGLAQPTIDEIG